MQKQEPGGRFVRFGSFEADLEEGKLTKSGYRIRLQVQPFRILALLLECPGQLVTREEIRHKLWSHDTFVEFDDVLNTSVRKLREALNDSVDNPRFLETVRGQGYRFLAPVAWQPEPQVVAPITSRVRRNLSLARRRSNRGRRSGSRILASFRPVSQIAPEDTIVLADFANTTGDPIFDDTLKTALSVSLRQSPFLNVLPNSVVAKTLQQMTRPADTKLTPEVARELCQRAGSKAYIAGAIGSLGNEFVLGLKAVNCQSGDTMAQEQVTAPSKENVLDALGKAASKLRGELGESLATVQKFDVPLAYTTTSSLEALKVYSLGLKAFGEKGPAAALPYHQRAVQLDPDFALGYDQLGLDYFGLSQVGRASEYFSKAFQLREHASEWERLAIAADYYLNVTGELDKAAQTYEEWIESYPREDEPYSSLGVVYASQGQYEKATEITSQALRLAPSLGSYGNLASFALTLQRFDDVQRITHEAQARKMDVFEFHSVLYALAFLRADSAAMAEQQKWFAGKPEENIGLALASDTEAFGGHLGKARELIKRAVDAAIRADSQESGAIWQANAAVQEAAYGNATRARHAAAQALKLAPASKAVEVEAALALAMAGETARAASLAQDLNKRFPLDTQLQSLWLPAIQSQLALDRKNFAYVLNAPQAASPIEFGQIVFVANVSCLYPVYVRGEGYLAAGQGSAAAAEFQKILDHSGIVWNCWTGALAHLGVARANALEARTLTRSGCRCRPRSGARRLQRFLHAMERRRPRHPHPETKPKRSMRSCDSSRTSKSVEQPLVVIGKPIHAEILPEAARRRRCLCASEGSVCRW